MASQVTIDFSSIGEQIVNAINVSLNMASDQLVGLKRNTYVEANKSNFDIREQILGAYNLVQRAMDVLPDQFQQTPMLCIA